VLALEKPKCNLVKQGSFSISQTDADRSMPRLQTLVCPQNAIQTANQIKQMIFCKLLLFTYRFPIVDRLLLFLLLLSAIQMSPAATEYGTIG
jgi:hypothetical protein